jgi:DNA processing protein
VTEGAEDSGALITAEFGIAYGRKVFAVPGPGPSSLSKGPYKLIEKGAVLVTDPKDVLRVLGLEGDKRDIRAKRDVKGCTEEEQVIIDLLQNESMSFDEIVRKVKRDSSQIASVVSLMEIKGLIKSNANGGFSIAT